MVRRARAARHEANKAERSASDQCVDSYYEATVFAYAAMMVARDPCAPDCIDRELATRLYNENLADCLRTAGIYGRLDPRAQLIVNTPRGATTVPVVHRGFVWSAGDFSRLVDPRCTERNPSQHATHARCGIGAPEVVVRPNPKTAPADKFMPESSFFPATAVLRPRLGDWLGFANGPGEGDVLELYDPLRVSRFDVQGQTEPLAADFDAAVAMAQAAVNSREYTLIGFINPATQLSNARLSLLEPYQPGKVVVVLLHGLLDNPYVFSDMVADLRARPGFVDHFQVAAFRYPTGITFLRSGSILRKMLREFETVFDPEHIDPGAQNMVLVGYSMGGLLSKLQITSSGDRLWNIAASRPIEALNTSEATKQRLRDTFYFEPLPFVRRTVFIATPHEGSALAARVLGRIASRLIETPADSRMMVEQLDRDNPGVIREYLRAMPTSIDLLAEGGPVLAALKQAPIKRPYHVIAGTGLMPPEHARGDGVVPLESAHVEGAESELWVPAFHTNIYYHPQTIEEVHRILQVHRAVLQASAPAVVGRFDGRQPAR
jgi:pimeloyl-ACP methyl ester carboxylesterase